MATPKKLECSGSWNVVETPIQRHPVCKNKPNLNIYLTFINPDKAKTYNENTNKY